MDPTTIITGEGTRTKKRGIGKGGKKGKKGKVKIREGGGERRGGIK